MTFRPSKRPPILRKFYNQKHKIVEVPLTRRFGGEIFQLEETGARLQMRWRREALRTSNKGIQTRIVRIGVGVPAYALWIRKWPERNQHAPPNFESDLRGGNVYTAFIGQGIVEEVDDLIRDFIEEFPDREIVGVWRSSKPLG